MKFFGGVAHREILCFLIFFSTTLMSMWLSSTLACGFMMPIVKAVLIELEKLGILEAYETTKKEFPSSSHNENDDTRPTDFTMFYFLGIAYSSTIGGIATISGSFSNQIFKHCYETFFPMGPKIEFPHFMLLTLPGVLVMEFFLYMWMNFFFLRMLRFQSYTALQTSLTGAEGQYAKMLLTTNYRALNKIKFQEKVVGCVIIFTIVLQIVSNSTYLGGISEFNICRTVKTSVPSIVGVVILFVTPIQLDCLRLCRRRGNFSKNLPVNSGKTCLTWSMVNKNMDWSIFFIIAGSNLTFEALREAKMTDEFEQFLLLFSKLSSPGLTLVVIIFSKICSEFASNATVTSCLLQHVAKLSYLTKNDPRCLMVSCVLASCLPFHFISGSTTNCMVAAYVHIPHRKMMIAGIGPTVIGTLVILFTACIWSRVVWPGVYKVQPWVLSNAFANKDV